MHYTRFKPFFFKIFLTVVIFPFVPAMASYSDILNTDRNSTLIAVGGGGHCGVHRGSHGGGHHRIIQSGGHYRGMHGGRHYRRHHRTHPHNYYRTPRYYYDPYYNSDKPYYEYRDRASSEGS